MDIEFCKNKIFEVLSCKIFDKEQFEVKFRNELDKCGVLNCLFLNIFFYFLFWVSKFGCKNLLQKVCSFVEEFLDYQFY